MLSGSSGGAYWTLNEQPPDCPEDSVLSKHETLAASARADDCFNNKVPVDVG